MPTQAFRQEHADLPYAMSRFLCQWLDRTGKLWPFYHAWRDAVTGDPNGEKAFERITGQTPRDANAAWLKWVRALF